MEAWQQCISAGGTGENSQVDVLTQFLNGCCVRPNIATCSVKYAALSW